jgi:hypothetical protein
MRKFLFGGFRNADYSDQLGFDSLGFRSGCENSPDAEPIVAKLPDSATPALPASVGSVAPAASFTSNCVLLNAISMPMM